MGYLKKQKREQIASRRRQETAEAYLLKQHAKKIKVGTRLKAESIRTRRVFKGTVTVYDARTGRAEIRIPGGITNTINVLNYAITLLPLLEKLWYWILDRVDDVKARRDDR
jgi:hypothetical protein